MKACVNVEYMKNKEDINRIKPKPNCTRASRLDATELSYQNTKSQRGGAGIKTTGRVGVIRLTVAAM